MSRGRVAKVLCIAPLAGWLVATAASAADPVWTDDLEIRGEAVSRLYLRSPGLDNDPTLSSWRYELDVEPSYEVYEGDELLVSLHGVLRPLYDSVYEISRDTWGDDADGGAQGTGSSTFADRARRGRSFPGSGGGVDGEFRLVNFDTQTTILGVTAPGFIVDQTLNFGALVAPFAPRGPSQPAIGGNATAGAYSRRAAVLALGGDPSLQNSLARASLPLATALNAAAASGAVGDRDSLDQLPADVNARQNALRFECMDNAHPWCFVRELYADIQYKDTFLRIGRQQIVWGAMDAFRIQDVVNPIDFGYRSIFEDLEKRRVPQLALDLQQSLHQVGPLHDVALEFAWVFDRFIPFQFGQCGEPYAPAIACQIRAQVAAHDFTNVGIAAVEKRDWSFKNTEPGLRLQFRLPEPSIDFSISAFYGFQDTPVARFVNHYSATNPNPAAMLFLQAQGLGPAIDALAGGGTRWSSGFDPYSAAEVGQANAALLGVWNGVVAPTAAAAIAGGADPAAAVYGLTVGGLPAGTYPLLALPWTGSEAVLEYPRVFTLGGSMSTEIPDTAAILRLEMGADLNRRINNTTRLSGVDRSPVFRTGIGVDRDVFIPFLNRNRTALVSFQTFFEHVIDYDDGNGPGSGMVVPENQVISTLIVRNRWLQDRLTLTTFTAYDWSAGAWAVSPTLRWVLFRNVAIDARLDWVGGSTRTHNLRDLCGSGTLSCLGSSPTTWQAGQWQASNHLYRRTAEGPWWSQQSFGDHFARRRQEVSVGMTVLF